MSAWPIYLYHVHLQDWDFEYVMRSLSFEELDSLRSITHKPTLYQKMMHKILLRYVLRVHYGIIIDRSSLGYSERGKPFLKQYPNLHFNGSHSHYVVLIGISENCPLGVDIEWMQPLPNEDELVREFFSPNEYSSYKELSNRSCDAFYKFWTAKESVIKAFGNGLWEADRVPEVLLNGDKFYLYFNSKILDDWTIEFIPIESGYSACLTINKPNIEYKVKKVFDFIL